MARSRRASAPAPGRASAEASKVRRGDRLPVDDVVGLTDRAIGREGQHDRVDEVVDVDVWPRARAVAGDEVLTLPTRPVAPVTSASFPASASISSTPVPRGGA